MKKKEDCECGEELMIFIDDKDKEQDLCPVCNVDDIVRIAMKFTYQSKYKYKGGKKNDD